jgi:hypothetical protein
MVDGLGRIKVSWNLKRADSDDVDEMVAVGVVFVSTKIDFDVIE